MSQAVPFVTPTIFGPNDCLVAYKVLNCPISRSGYSSQGLPITSREPDVAPLLKGIEQVNSYTNCYLCFFVLSPQVFNDGLSEGSTIWDFVGMSDDIISLNRMADEII